MEKSISSDLNNFYQALDHQEWMRFVNYIYIGEITKQRRDSLYALWSKHEVNAVKNIRIEFDQVKKIYKSVRLNENVYVLIQYSYVIQYDLTETKNEDGANLALAYFFTDKKNIYGKRNVNFNSQTGICKVKVHDEIVAVKTNTSENWMFIQKELAGDPQIHIPLEVLRQMKIN